MKGMDKGGKMPKEGHMMPGMPMKGGYGKPPAKGGKKGGGKK